MLDERFEICRIKELVADRADLDRQSFFVALWLGVVDRCPDAVSDQIVGRVSLDDIKIWTNVSKLMLSLDVSFQYIAFGYAWISSSVVLHRIPINRIQNRFSILRAFQKKM
jgi:hypothetical protein